MNDYLDGNLKEIVLNRALAAARELREEPSYALSLAGIIPNLDGSLREKVLQDAVEAIHKLKHSSDIVRALVYLAPYLGKDNIEQAMAIAHAITSTTARIRALCSLAPYFDEKQIEDMLLMARSITTESTYCEALLDIAPHLNNKLRILVLQEVLYLANEAAFRKVLSIWNEIEFRGLKENIPPLAKHISQKNRKVGFEYTAILTPALVHFRGPEIVPELYRAITDVTRWWP